VQGKLNTVFGLSHSSGNHIYTSEREYWNKESKSKEKESAKKQHGLVWKAH